MLRACASRGGATALRPAASLSVGCRAFSIAAVDGSKQVIWYNGEMVPWESANVHILSTAVQFGMSMFEGIRADAASSQASMPPSRCRWH